jgi:hypothetical protein
MQSKDVAHCIGIKRRKNMEDIKGIMADTSSMIADSGYMIESQSYTEEDSPLFRINFYDMKHITQYSYTARYAAEDEEHKISDITATAVFLSGIKEDIEKTIKGLHGSIKIHNIGNSMECRII